MSRSAALVSPGSESRGGGGAAGSSRAGREFPGAGQRERQRRVRVMRAVRTMLYYIYQLIYPERVRFSVFVNFLYFFHTLSDASRGSRVALHCAKRAV